VRKLQEAGKKVIFVTNNSAKGPEDLCKKFVQLDFPPISPTEVVAAVHVAVAFALALAAALALAVAIAFAIVVIAVGICAAIAFAVFSVALAAAAGAVAIDEVGADTTADFAEPKIRGVCIDFAPVL
jgi:hypothetical protein